MNSTISGSSAASMAATEVSSRVSDQKYSRMARPKVMPATATTGSSRRSSRSLSGANTASVPNSSATASHSRSTRMVLGSVPQPMILLAMGAATLKAKVETSAASQPRAEEDRVGDGMGRMNYEG